MMGALSFASSAYFLFLAAAFAAYRLAPHRFRRAALLAASLLFYATLGAPHLLAVLGLAAGISYAAGIRIAGAADDRSRSLAFRTGTALLLSLLAAARHLPALLPAGGAGSVAWTDLAVSAGVSYFVFQAIAYLADVHLGVQEAERDAGVHALSLAFFPKLLQGPIERAGHLLPQLKKEYAFDYGQARSGLILLAWGLFKKSVVADRIGPYADAAFDDPASFRGVAAWLGVYAYALRIYYDFSGYTDMARGAARLFGIELSENFRAPYLSPSIAEFWRRWHITFSRWILDYLFRPMQMAWRGLGQAGTALALVLTFLASGLWHGATRGFLAWGLLHGLYLAASTLWRPWQKKLHRRLGVEKSRWYEGWRILVTFHLVCLAWIFFRADDLGRAFGLVAGLADLPGKGLSRLLLLKSRRELAILAAALLVLSLKDRLASSPIGERVMSGPFRWAAYYLLALSILVLGVRGYQAFIYAQF
jgi:D-alanyl-lipoteichoic acid acyltransferase DltB (MBOAT superfamily)